MQMKIAVEMEPVIEPGPQVLASSSDGMIVDKTSPSTLVERSFYLPGILSLILIPFLAANVAASDFDGLASRIPSGANLVLAIDVDRTLATPMAISNGWGDPTKSATRPTYLPPEADKVIVAAHVDPPRQFARSWEVALMGMKETIPMRLVARAEGGYTDEINGRPAAWVPSDAYFVSIDPNTLGLMYPADRQAVSRWVGNQAAGKNQGPSSYLQAAINKAKTGPQIVLALDSLDVTQPHRVQKSLSESPVISSQKLNVAELVPVLSTMKGLVVSISITDRARLDAQIDFGKPVNFSASAAKALVLGALTKFEAELPGMDKWKFNVSGSSILAGGDLDPSALMRLLSFLEIPTTKFSSLKDADTETSGADEMKNKSLAYFQSISKLIDDLQKASKSSTGDNYWFDRYAQKIDRLPILHVDPDLLDFGQKTGETLRVMSGARKSANMQGGLAVSNVAANGGGRGYDNYGNSYGNSGYYGGAVNQVHSSLSGDLASVNATKTQAKAGATGTKIQGFKLIDEASVEIRRAMTERYNVEF